MGHGKLVGLPMSSSFNICRSVSSGCSCGTYILEVEVLVIKSGSYCGSCKCKYFVFKEGID